MFASDENKATTNSKCQSNLDERLGHLTPSESTVIEPVINRYDHIFHDDGNNNFKIMHLVEQKMIITGNAQPIRKAQYRVPFAL
jgi:hypothetical protein